MGQITIQILSKGISVARAIRMDLIATQIRQRLPDDNSHDDHRDQHEEIGNRGGETGEDIVLEEDGGDDAVDDCDAGL